MVEGDKQENKFPEGKLERLAEQNHQNGSWRTNYIFVERLTDTASDIWGLANYHLSENTTVKKKKNKTCFIYFKSIHEHVLRHAFTKKVFFFNVIHH